MEASGTIYLPVWCWRRGTIKPVMHHSACGPAAWKHRTKNISQTLQLRCKRTVPTMTLVSWHWYEPIQSLRTAGTGGGCVAWVRPEAVGDDWSSSVVRAVGFQKGGSRLRRLAPKVINPVRRHHLRGCVGLWPGGFRAILSLVLLLLLLRVHLIWEEGDAHSANLYTSSEILLSNDYLTACLTAAYKSPRAYTSKCRPTSISARSLYQSPCDCYDSQGQWENSSAVGTPAQMSRAVTPEASRPFREKPAPSHLASFIDRHWPLTSEDTWGFSCASFFTFYLLTPNESLQGKWLFSKNIVVSLGSAFPLTRLKGCLWVRLLKDAQQTELLS